MTLIFKGGSAMSINNWRHNNVDNIPETQFCIDCIYHEVYVVRGYTHENCVIWGLDGCHNGCNRKKTEPEYRWTDSNRWEKD